MLVEIVNNDTDKEVECEERTKDDEDDKVYVHVEVDLIRGLLLYLKGKNTQINNGKIRECNSFLCWDVFEYVRKDVCETGRRRDRIKG